MSNGEPFNDWGGGGCHTFVPVSGGDGTKIAPPGALSDQPPGKMSWIRGKLAEHVGDHVALSPEDVLLMPSPGTKSSYPAPPQSLKHSGVLWQHTSYMSTIGVCCNNNQFFILFRGNFYKALEYGKYLLRIENLHFSSLEYVFAFSQDSVLALFTTILSQPKWLQPWQPNPLHPKKYHIFLEILEQGIHSFAETIS